MANERTPSYVPLQVTYKDLFGYGVLQERLTFDQLLRLSDPERIERSRSVRGPALEVLQWGDSTGYAFNFKANPSTTGLRHRGYIRFYKPKKKTPLQNLQCVVDCECPDYKYRWAWSNKQRRSSNVGSGSLNQAWDKAPRITNPTGAPGLCVAEGELVSTESGFKPIEDVRPNERVWTLHGWQTATAVQCTGEKEVVEILLHSGRTLRLTAEHQVYAFNEADGFTWKPAAFLTSEDRLVQTLPTTFKAKTIQYQIKECDTRTPDGGLYYAATTAILDETLAELLGYMTAEGSVSLFAAETELLRGDFYRKWVHVFGKESARQRPGGVFIGAHGTRILAAMGFRFGSYNKVVPPAILTGSREVIIAYLRGCYAGDGNFRVRHSTYGTVSEPLARTIQLLLSLVGVQAALDCYPSGVNRALTWVVRTSSQEETQRLFNLLRPLRGWSTEGNENGAIGHHNYLIKKPRKFFERLVHRHLPVVTDETVVVINDACGDFGVKSGEAATRMLVASGLPVIKLRQAKASGKAHNAARLCDLAVALKPAHVRAIMRKVKSPYGGSWNCRRDKLQAPLERLKDACPTAFQECQLLRRNELVFDEVVTVRPRGGKVRVWDMSVPEVEHFTVNGIVVHNCKHLLALRDYIYGQYEKIGSKDQEEEDNAVSRLDRMTRRATKRWINYSGAITQGEETTNRNRELARKRKEKAELEQIPEPPEVTPKMITPVGTEDYFAPQPGAQVPAPPDRQRWPTFGDSLVVRSMKTSRSLTEAFKAREKSAIALVEEIEADVESAEAAEVDGETQALELLGEILAVLQQMAGVEDLELPGEEGQEDIDDTAQPTPGSGPVKPPAPIDDEI